MADYDLAIIGGGLNGVSVARDAAGRGLRVILPEQGDLGAGCRRLRSFRRPLANRTALRRTGGGKRD